jgi:lipoprotein LprG
MPAIGSVRAAVVVLVSAVALAACGQAGPRSPSSTPEGGNALPAGSALLADAAAAMAGIESVHFHLDVTGTVPGTAVYAADADLKKSGDGRGTARVEIAQQRTDLDFVIVGPILYFRTKGTDDYQRIALALASTLYDPSAVLDPTSGIGRLLSSATRASTLAIENVGNAPAFKVTFTPDPAALINVIAGANGTGSTATVWVDQSTKLVVKALFDWPAAGGQAGGTALATFTEFNKSISISAP